jgi:hypothetical protein
VIMAYRMYFKDGELDPDFPAPVPPKEIVVPAEKPRTGSKPYYFAVNGGEGDEGADSAGEGPSPKQVGGSAPASSAEDPLDRRSVLKEVREVSRNIPIVCFAS